MVGQALRQFFLAHLTSGRQFVSMPSQLADDLWHEFILYTKHYENFCGKAFGRFPTTPAVVLGSARDANAGCAGAGGTPAAKRTSIPGGLPARPPFALDTKFGIADGFHYVADCGSVRNVHDRGIGGSIAAVILPMRASPEERRVSARLRPPAGSAEAQKGGHRWRGGGEVAAAAAATVGTVAIPAAAPAIPVAAAGAAGWVRWRRRD